MRKQMKPRKHGAPSLPLFAGWQLFASEIKFFSSLGFC